MRNSVLEMCVYDSEVGNQSTGVKNLDVVESSSPRVPRLSRAEWVIPCFVPCVLSASLGPLFASLLLRLRAALVHKRMPEKDC